MIESITTAIETALKNCAINFLQWIVGGIVSCSYWICLFICMIAFIFYISGNRKAGRWASSSFIAYIIIQVLGRLII